MIYPMSRLNGALRKQCTEERAAAEPTYQCVDKIFREVILWVGIGCLERLTQI